MTEPTSYQGGSAFLRWWPGALLAVAFAALLIGGVSGIKWATVLVLAACFHARWMPWQFTIREDGLALTFPFGRRVFLQKATLKVRMEVVGATALVGRHRRLGYPLLDSILYQPGRAVLLRTAFTGLGYELH